MSHVALIRCNMTRVALEKKPSTTFTPFANISQVALNDCNTIHVALGERPSTTLLSDPVCNMSHAVLAGCSMTHVMIGKTFAYCVLEGVALQAPMAAETSRRPAGAALLEHLQPDP